MTLAHARSERESQNRQTPSFLVAIVFRKLSSVTKLREALAWARGRARLKSLAQGVPVPEWTDEWWFQIDKRARMQAREAIKRKRYRRRSRPRKRQRLQHYRLRRFRSLSRCWKEKGRYIG